jgi:hypothetical protein
LVIDPATIGINENANIESNVKLFPNPSSDFVSLEFLNSTTTSKKKITILNILGEEIYSEQTSDSKFKVDMEKWSSGIYIFQIQMDDVVVNKKIIKK